MKRLFAISLIFASSFLWLKGQTPSEATASEHWAFQAPSRPEIPKNDWGFNAIDKFIAAAHDKHGLSPNPPEAPARLLRRLTFDLTGLPPSPQEISAFREMAAQYLPAAVDVAVGQLLTTDGYAEHFARHWLDAARYADTHGLGHDSSRSIWPYRDWVISAFRQNMPFDQFTREQLAGDLLPDATLNQKVATGFNRCLATTGLNDAPAAEVATRYALEQANTTATIWLGLDLGSPEQAAPPFTQKDLFAFAAFFNNTTMAALDQNKPDHPPLAYVPIPPAERAQLEALEAEVQNLPDQEQNLKKTRLLQEIAELKKLGFPTLIMEEKNEAASIQNLTNEKVFARIPSLFQSEKSETHKSRLDLANWLLSAQNPLTARATVNRLWDQFFGRGLVEASAGFGPMGAQPTHPKLLDYLALELIEHDWNLQHIIKLIITSATYQQSGKINATNEDKDAKNHFLTRAARQRLDAEQIRDLALSASGLLVRKVGGPSVKPYQAQGSWEAVASPQSDTQSYERDQGSALYRRSLYTFWKRNAAPANMRLLDAPSRNIASIHRHRSNTPHSALVTLNDPQLMEASRALATKALKASQSPSQRLNLITIALMARTLENEEQQIIQSTLEKHLKKYRSQPALATQLLTIGELKADPSLDAPELAAWTLIASQILNLDETLTK